MSIASAKLEKFYKTLLPFKENILCALQIEGIKFFPPLSATPVAFRNKDKHSSQIEKGFRNSNNYF